MEHYLNIAIRSIFIENMALAFFLGMCSFLACSKKVETAIGLGLAVVFVQVLTVPLNNLILRDLLSEGALGLHLSGAGQCRSDLSCLHPVHRHHRRRGPGRRNDRRPLSAHALHDARASSCR